MWVHVHCTIIGLIGIVWVLVLYAAVHWFDWYCTIIGLIGIIVWGQCIGLIGIVLGCAWV